MLASLPAPMRAQPPVAARRGTSPAARRRRAMFGLLHRVEHGAATGLLRLRVEGQEVGRLIARGGRLCMAVAVGGDGHPPKAGVDRTLDGVVQSARRQGRTLSDSVRELADAQRALVRDGLRRECVGGLQGIAAALAAAGQEPILEISAARDNYAPELTFGALDLFVACASETELPADEHACIVYKSFAACGQTGLFAMRDAEAGVPPFLAGGYHLGDMTLREAIVLVRCAAELCRPWPAVEASGAEPSCAVFHDARGAWVCVPSQCGIALLRYTAGSRAESLISWILSRSQTRPDRDPVLEPAPA